ncbi:MAG TPA: gluconokinase [Candidatus Limnocylindrales bacterium]
MILVVSGVAGSGKTTIGKLLAQRLSVPYAEADDFHTEANRLRMAAGLALSDEDRQPWLDAIANWIDERIAAGLDGVITCSALKKRYRERLTRPRARLVFLKVDRETIDKRLAVRRGHFFPAGLADSQFEALEEPDPSEEGVVIVDGTKPVEEVVSEILRMAVRGDDLA